MSQDSQAKIVFVGHARSLLGAAWRHRGRKPWALDCLGLVVLSAHAAGWPVVDEPFYGREPWDDKLRRVMRQQLGDPIPRKEDMEPGDVVLIHWRDGDPTHVGIIGNYIYGGVSLIHCDTIDGCVEHSIDQHYIDCIMEVYRPCVKFCQ